MATLDEERYLRNLLLLGEGTSFVLKSLVVQEESRSGQTLENLLLNNKTLFNGILKEQRDILYPAPLTANVDLTTWDLSLLLLVVKRLFYPVLPPVIVSQIAALKAFRDSIIGHPRKMSMDDTEFLTNQAHLQGHLRNIAGYVNQRRQIEDIIGRTATGKIDIESVYRHVNEMHAFRTSLKLFIEEKFEQIKPILSSLESNVKTIKENVDVIKDNQSDPNDGMKRRLQSLQDSADGSKQDIKEFRGCQDRIYQTIFKLRYKFVRKTKHDFIKDLNTIIQAECGNEEKQKNATDLLFDFVKIIQDDNFFHNDEIKMIISQRVEWYGEITFQLMDDLIEWFTDIDELCYGIGKARLGSIILPIFCSSETGVFRVFEYANSSQCKKHLSRISTTVSTLFSFPCSFTWGVEFTSLQSVLASYWDNIGTESSKKKLKNLVLPVHVSNKDGLINIWKMFGEHERSRHLDNVSRTLSAIFDEEIRLRTYVDKDQLLENLKETESRKRGFRPLHLSKTISTTGCMMVPWKFLELYFCKHEIRSRIQPVVVASVLYRNGVLAESSYSLIKHTFAAEAEKEKISEFLIEKNPCCMNLENFVQLLDECGYRYLARRIFLTCYTGRISFIHKSKSGKLPMLKAYYRNLKWVRYNCLNLGSLLELRRLYHSLHYRMQMEGNQTRRQILANKCILVKAAEIDIMLLLRGKHLLEDVVLMEMKELVTETSNTSISDVLYLGRLAFAKLLAGNFNDGRDILVEATCRAYNVGACEELFDMFYSDVCHVRLEIKQIPTKELQKQIILRESMGFDWLEDVDEEIIKSRRHMCKSRIRMMFYLIGLSNRTNAMEKQSY